MEEYTVGWKHPVALGLRVAEDFPQGTGEREKGAATRHVEVRSDII